MHAVPRQRRAVLAITMGEPAGIGGQLALKAWCLRHAGGPMFLLLDDPSRLTALARRLRLDAPIQAVSDAREAAAVWAHALPVLPMQLPHAVAPGQPDPANAPAVLSAIERAVALALQGEVDGVVTNPVHKKTLYSAGFTFPGHTEYLGELGGSTTAPVMMLAIDGLRTVPVTTHVSLSKAVGALGQEHIEHCGRVTTQSLRRDFGIGEPRLAVAALNPHAGESGTMGHEEETIIAPAVAALRADGIDACGPFPADTMFHQAARATYDAAICMYHDQALIPVKCLDFDHGVNVTLGLPFVRTSPDHGTALDIAATDRARPDSLLAALQMAAAMAERRAERSPALDAAISH